MTGLIHKDQNRFVPTRSTSGNLWRLFHIMHHPEWKQYPEALILSVDLEKAFDSVRWDFLDATMEWMGLGEGWTKCVKMLYTHQTARVKTSGVVSGTYKIFKGTRQGCPLSPLLFAIALELLAIAFRQQSHTLGI